MEARRADARRTASGPASCITAASAVATVALALHDCVLMLHPTSGWHYLRKRRGAIPALSA
jgi:hypothetical protein